MRIPTIKQRENNMGWFGINQIEPKSYLCGHAECNQNVSSNYGSYDQYETQNRVHICPSCNKATVFGWGIQYPGAIPGAKIRALPDDINALYDESRQCIAIAAYTASVLLSRKLLMHIAVEQKAEPNKAFGYYVSFLADNGFIPPNGKAWVAHIKDKGNEANHEIVLMTKDDAEELLVFMEMLLKFIYEFPARIPASPEKG
jgi:hypothetical protein